MKWTDKPPQEPGWYFFQRIEAEGKIYPVRVGYVDKKFYPWVHREEMTIFDCDARKSNASRHPVAEMAICDMDTPHSWAGPIPEPEE